MARHMVMMVLPTDRLGSGKWRRRRGAPALRRALAFAEVIRLRGLRVTGSGQQQRHQ
jgi:hypothetical protein